MRLTAWKVQHGLLHPVGNHCKGMSCLRLTNVLRVFNKQKQELIDTEVDVFRSSF